MKRCSSGRSLWEIAHRLCIFHDSGQMRRTDSLLFVPVVLLSPTYGHAQPWSGIVASSRVTDWSTAGVEGGIPSAAWTQCAPTIAAYTGSASTINTAISNCGVNHYVKLASGTFTLSSGIHLSKSNVVLRGSGANQTSLIINGVAPTSCNEWTANAISVCTGNNGPAGS